MTSALTTLSNVATKLKFETLGLEPPSILQQTKWPCGIYCFPDETPQRQYFNCSIIDWRGQRWLVTRKNEQKYIVGFRNGITFWLLNKNVPVMRQDVRFFKAFAKEEHEDARVLVRNGNLILTYCNFIQGRTFAHQCIGALTPDFRLNLPVHIEYGDNGSKLILNKGHEKNWVWFEHGGLLHFVYRTNPHVVCKTRNGAVIEEFKTEAPKLNWTFGELRGGTSPVKVGDEFVSFFHSSMPWKNNKRRYYMGAYAFESEPPFRITRYTPQPLLIGSAHDEVMPNIPWPVVVFPCGAIFEKNEWLVVGGLNDLRCFWIRIPHADLLQRMIAC